MRRDSWKLSQIALEQPRGQGACLIAAYQVINVKERQIVRNEWEGGSTSLVKKAERREGKGEKEEGRKEGERLHHVTRSTLVGAQMIDVSVFRHILFKLYDINAISREFY